MRQHNHPDVTTGTTYARWWWRLLPVVLFLFACGGTTTVIVPGATNTPGHHATATPSGPPPHAFAWTQYDGHSVPQIWASLNGAVPAQITHLGPPSSSGIGCGDPFLWGLPVFSPDLHHIVAADGSFNCGDGVLNGQLNIIDVSSGALAPVPGATGVRLTERVAGWIDNNTIYWIDASGGHTYALGAGSAATLPGMPAAEDAVLRGNTLFYLQFNSGGPTSLTVSESLHRYDLTSHAVMSGSISLGQYRNCACSPGDYHTAGWDVSPDGTHIAYQVMVPLTSTTAGIASSQIMYANADGSGATSIAQSLNAHATINATGLVGMQFAPNDQLLAITSSAAGAITVTASVSSSGASGDPNYHTYAPNGLSFPVWKWDSSQFWAGTVVYADTSSGPTGTLYDYTVASSSAAVGVSGGYNPWYTIGH